MALPLDAALPPKVELGPGYTLRVTALSTLDGTVVSQVKVTSLNVLLDGTFLGAQAGGPSGPFRLVPGPDA